MEEFFIGRGQLQLKNLATDLCRDRLDTATERLLPVFRANCSPTLDANQIQVKVWPSELNDVLTSSDTSLEALSQGVPPYARLRASQKVQCLHGRQRYEAAIKAHGPEFWWTVQIFCIPEGSDATVLLRKQVEQYHHETPFSDGDIYLKVRQYQRLGDLEREKEWRLRLSNHKQKALGRLLKKSDIVDKLDQLGKFPGLWNGFELGNIEDHLSSHGFDVMAHCLQHIYDVFVQITLGDHEIEAATDIETVQTLQLRAPSASQKDREELQKHMQQRVLFSRIWQQETRRRIKDSILSLKVVIPSLKTFHRNMKYVSIGLKIIKSNILGKLLRDESVFHALKEIWRCPTKRYVEYEENRFEEIANQPDPQSACQELFMVAIRDHPNLSTSGPRCERGMTPVAASRRDTAVSRFLRRAQILGFRTPGAEELQELSVEDGTVDTTLVAVDHQEKHLNRRWGSPLARSFHCIHSHLFLPGLMEDTPMQDYPTTLFIQRDIICSYLGPLQNLPRRNSRLGLSDLDALRALQSPEASLMQFESDTSGVSDAHQPVSRSLQTLPTEFSREPSLTPTAQLIDDSTSETRSFLTPQVGNLVGPALVNIQLQNSSQIMSAAAWALENRNQRRNYQSTVYEQTSEISRIADTTQLRLVHQSPESDSAVPSMTLSSLSPTSSISNEAIQDMNTYHFSTTSDGLGGSSRSFIQPEGSILMRAD
ncbi:hypothetical protein F4824DRAFT_507940 [Ustulina deusta]|nr:hypothetical protein F4824DRAFT_507940 [Ustulina deusta]